LFTDVCESGFKNSRLQRKLLIILNKYSHNSTDEADKIDIMFRFIQYIERQIVLFDAVEDAAFPIVNNMEGRGSLRISKKSRCKRKERRID
jgi:phosphoenolpyruvate carboxylase